MCCHQRKRNPVSKIIWPWCKARCCSIEVTIPSNERMGILWISLISMVRETDFFCWSLCAVCKCSAPSLLNMPAMAESSATVFLTSGAGNCVEIGLWGKKVQLEIVHPRGDSGDILCSVRFTWTHLWLKYSRPWVLFCSQVLSPHLKWPRSLDVVAQWVLRRDVDVWVG